MVINLTEALRRSLARLRWEAELARELGPDAPKALKLLHANQHLAERATTAEQRKPGTGVWAAMIAIKRLQSHQ